MTLAVPGSAVDGRTLEAATMVAGAIGRSAAAFEVDEVVVYEDRAGTGEAEVTQATAFLARVLDYLETPPALRRTLFPSHPHLKLVSMISPLDATMPHHVGGTSAGFSEGVVAMAGSGSAMVDVGTGSKIEVKCEGDVKVGARVTVRVGKMGSEVAGFHAPRSEKGLYWGWATRVAKGLAGIFTGCPFPDGYDCTIGVMGEGGAAADLGVGACKHVLLVLGGADGLEGSLERDPLLEAEHPRHLFDHLMRAVPGGAGRANPDEECWAALGALSQVL